MAAASLTAEVITVALIKELAKSAPDAVVLEEFACPSGRLDVLAVTDRLDGFEVKSDLDSLQRVESQLAAYTRYCQTLTFVAGKTLAVPLLRRLPSWCGVMLAIRAGNEISFLELRKARRNPFADAQRAALLLRRDELISLTDCHEARPSRAQLRTAFTRSTHGESEIFEVVAASLRLRARLKAAGLRASCDGSSLLAAKSSGCLSASSDWR